jgi:imidazolonepropionase-like amidohydrolase
MMMTTTLMMPMATALALAVHAAPARDSKPSAKMAIIHAQVHVGDGTIVQDATVIVEGERIAAVGPHGLADALPKDTQVIDAKGHWLTPGFMATDSPMGLVEIGAESSTVDIPEDLNSGIVSSFEPSTAIRLDAATIGVAASAGFTGAVSGNDQGLLAGYMSFVDLVPGGDNSRFVRAKVAARANLGHSRRASRIENLARMREVLSDARFYQRNKAAYDRGQSRALAAHPNDLEALFPVLSGDIPLVIEAQRASDLLASIALAQEFKLRLVLVGASEGWLVANELAKADVAVLLQPTQNLPSSFDQINARLDNAALMHKAGVKILLADVESPHMVPTIKQEAGIAVAPGLSHETAISALTLNVAQAFRLDKDLGSVAKGKFANLVLWSGDPFEFSTKVEGVMVRGQIIELRSRQTMLRERYRNLKAYRP